MSKIECYETQARVIEKLRRAVNKHCTCGGRGPEFDTACPACRVWHDVLQEAP